MRVYIIDDDKKFLENFEAQLKRLGFYNLKSFHIDEIDFDYIQKHKPDVIIFNKIFSSKKKEEIFKKLKEKFEDIVYIAIISKDEKDYDKYIDLGINSYLRSDYFLEELKVKLKCINRFIAALKREKKENKRLKKRLEYKDIQEELAIIKQKKLLKNELFMFFEDEHLIEDFIKPKDVLSGDSVFSKRIKENEYILGIVDAMGKGLNASLTSIAAIVFLQYSVEKAVEKNDFDFERSIKDFFNYVKSMLLNNETLSAIFIYIKKDKLFFANFGMPPIYTPENKYRANNPSIIKTMKNFKIDEIVLPDKFFVFSDGLIESRLKNKQSIYYERFLNMNFPFLKNLVDDFEENAIQDDDVTIIHYKKDKMFEEKLTISGIIKDKKSIDEVLQKVPKTLKSYSKIIYILQELLMNTLEHSIYDLKMKKEYIDLDSVEEKNKYVSVNISFFEKGEFSKILYKENSTGFDVNVLKDLYDAKYHGKGIKIIKFLSEGVFFNYKGSEIKIFLKDE